MGRIVRDIVACAAAHAGARVRVAAARVRGGLRPRPSPRVLKISIALPGYPASSRVREKFPDRDFGTWVGAWNGEPWTERQGRRARDGEPGTESRGRRARSGGKAREAGGGRDEQNRVPGLRGAGMLISSFLLCAAGGCGRLPRGAAEPRMCPIRTRNTGGSVPGGWNRRESVSGQLPAGCAESVRPCFLLRADGADRPPGRLPPRGRALQKRSGGRKVLRKRSAGGGLPPGQEGMKWRRGQRCWRA